MSPIAVRPYPLAQTFDSFEAAIQHTLAHPRQPAARRDADRLRDAVFVDAWWTDSECGLRFDTGLSLRVRATPSGVCWRLRPSDAVRAMACRVGEPQVVLDLPNVGRWPMDTSTLVAKRRGAALDNLFVNEFGLFVYLRKRLILCLGHVERVRDGRAILYIYEDH